MKRTHASLSALVASLAATSTAAAQSNWVDFVDETSTRLVLHGSNPDLGNLTCDDELDMAKADLDGDGDDDLVVVRLQAGYTQVALSNFLLINENGVFHDKTPTNIPGFLVADSSRDVICADVDGDLDQDIIVANTYQEQPRLFLNNGSAVFTEATNWFTSNGSNSFSPGPLSCSVVAEDIDGDSDLDIFLSTYRFAAGDLDSRILVNDGTGQFTDETSLRLGSLISNAFVTGATMADFNNDGSPDIQISRPPSSIRVAYNDGTGIFTCATNYSIPGGAPYMHGVADFANTGLPDLYAVQDQQDRTVYNLGVDPNANCVGATLLSTAITVKSSPRTASLGGNLTSVDIDGDGWTDMAVCDAETGEPTCGFMGLALLQNQGGLTGRPFLKDPNNFGGNLITLPWNMEAWDVTFSDVNNDGCQDMIIASSVDGMHIFIQTGCN